MREKWNTNERVRQENGGKNEEEKKERVEYKREIPEVSRLNRRQNERKGMAA